MYKPLVSGTPVIYNGRLWRVDAILKTRRVIIFDEVSGDRKEVANEDLSNATEGTPQAAPIDIASSKHWHIASFRRCCIEPLVNVPARTRKMVGERAEELGLDSTTLYRWLAAYEPTRELSSLLPKRIERPKRLSSVHEEIIASVKESMYLTLRQATQAAVVEEVERLCRERGIKPPHKNTVRNRLLAVTPRTMAKRRSGTPESQKFELLKGQFPGATHPLAIVEIDHCLLDVMVVDASDSRPAIGRPWLTLGMDVYSRSITGFYLSPDSPSTASVAMCIFNSIMPKRDFIQKHGLESDWPCWGKMDAILVDNAKEFRSGTLVRACQEHGISVEWRPAKRPHFAGHIERFFGDIQRDLRDLPGATFASPLKRGTRNPVKTASMTLDELEHWLAIRIVDGYHNRVHSSTNTSPLDRYKKGLIDPPDGLPRGVPAPFGKPQAEKLLLDFMPSYWRTVQPYGVVIDGCRYRHDALQPFVRARDPNSKGKLKCLFKRNPLNISELYFLHPRLMAYLRIPAADRSMPPMTLWSWRYKSRVEKMQRQSSGNRPVANRSIVRMREVASRSMKTTKAARRGKPISDRVVPRMPNPSSSKLTTVPRDDLNGISDDLVQPFEELE